MKRTWWRVPLYCLVAGWICFQLEIRFLGRFALVKLPDGSLSSDSTRWMIMSGILFLVVILVGGLVFFRGMTRKQLFCSASVLVCLNIVIGLIVYVTQGMAAFFWAELSEWDSFVSQLLISTGLNIWVSTVIVWVLPPYVFVLFGKSGHNRGEQDEKV